MKETNQSKKAPRGGSERAKKQRRTLPAPNRRASEPRAEDDGRRHAGAASGADDARSLYPSIRLDQVWGLNVAPPEGAKTCVKPWHEREDTSRWTESGVDDQVSALRASSSRRHLGCWARAATDAVRPA